MKQGTIFIGSLSTDVDSRIGGLHKGKDLGTAPIKQTAADGKQPRQFIPGSSL